MKQVEHCRYTQLPIILHTKCKIKAGKFGFMLSLNGITLQKPTRECFNGFSLTLQNLASDEETYTCKLHNYAEGYIFDTQFLPEFFPIGRYKLILGTPYHYTIDGVTMVNNYPKTSSDTVFVPCGQMEDSVVESESAIVIFMIACYKSEECSPAN